jgi:LysM repeat protein
MKKFILVLVVAALVFGCATKEPAEGSYSQAEADSALKSAYDRYRGNLLIQEGAAQYKVASGDTLSKIALNSWGAGNGYYFPLIMAASPGTVSDPDKIQPGMNLTIPDLQKNLDSPVAKKALKSLLLDTASVYVGKGNKVVADDLKAQAAKL